MKWERISSGRPDRLHTFTSPLGVLILTLCTWLAGPDHELAALRIFRVFNATLLAATLLFSGIGHRL
jgi:hypothetical protein